MATDVQLKADDGLKAVSASTGWVLHPVLAVVGRRLLLSVPLFFVVSALSFVLLAVLPGDAASLAGGFTATPSEVAALRRAMGLNLPIYEQYWHWLEHAVGGNLGTSLVSGEPVAQIIGQRVAVSAALIGFSLLITLVAGVALGVLSAARGRVVGRTVDALGLLGFALPSFLIGAVLIELFAVRLRLFPATGYTSPAQSVSGWLRSLALPVFALSLGGVAAVAKNTREAMLDVMTSEHIRVAAANGVPARAIYLRYALKNAAGRIATILGLITVGLLAGTVLVETVFALPGLGAALVTAIDQHDLPTVQGIAVFFTAIVVLVNLAIDLSYIALDPRVRMR